MTDPNPKVAGDGLRELASAGIAVESGVLQKQAESLNAGFITRMTRQRPYVRCKLAMSVDGRTAMASGESKWITGPAARRDVQRWRALSSAVVTGIGTVLADDPSLNVRSDELESWTGGATSAPRQPARVILDPRLECPPSAKMLGLPGHTIIVASEASGPADRGSLSASAEVVSLPGTAQTINLYALMDFLANREINEVFLESGATLSGAMLKMGLVDELILYMAPLLMGSGARSLFHLPGLQHMDQRIHLHIAEIRAVGADWRITARTQPLT